MKNSVSSRGFSAVALLLIGAVVLAGGGLYLYRRQAGSYPETANPPLGRVAKATTSPTQPKKGLILKAEMTKRLDTKTGQGLDAATVFSPNEPAIYMAMSVDKPVKGTKFEYVRYLNGKYVDHKSINMAQNATQYASFGWKLKSPSARHPAGDYRVKLYANGNFEKELTYQVR